jgi:hypothetical protein
MLVDPCCHSLRGVGGRCRAPLLVQKGRQQATAPLPTGHASVPMVICVTNENVHAST